MSPRPALPLLSLPLTLALAACPSATPSDASVEDITTADRPIDSQRQDASDALVFDDTGDAIVLDAASMDGAADVSSDDASTRDVIEDTAAMMGLDVAVPDVVLPAQPCSFASTPVAFGAGGRGARNVYVSSDFTGFSAGASILRDGANNVWIQRVNREGAPTLVGAISNAPSGAMVRGGHHVLTGMFYLVTWSQSEAADELVYLKLVQSNLAEVSGSRQRVTASGIHQDPQVVSLRVGHMIAWRSVESGRGRVRIAPYVSGTVGTIVAVSDASEDVLSFRLLSSQIADVYAIAYRDIANNMVRVRTFDATGAARGTVEVASGADLGPTVDAAIEDDGDAWITWAQPATGGSIRLRRVGLAPGGAGTGAAINLMTPAGSADPGVASTGADVVVAYRNLAAPVATLDFVRVTSDEAIRDRSQLGGVAEGGRIGVDARDGRFGLAWTDDLSTGAVTRIGVVVCR